MSIENVYNDVISCSKCGFCQPTCPTFVVSGKEHQVARGRHQLVRGIIENKIELTRDTKEMIFECLMCNACYSNCFPSVKTDHVIAHARHEYIKKYGQPALQKYIFKHLLRHPKELANLLKLVSVGKNSGLSRIVQVFRVLGWFGRNLANAEQLLEKIPFKNLRERMGEKNITVPNAKGKIAYFSGCGINYAQPDIGEASIKVMQNFGYDVEILDNVCCGLPAYAYGDLDSVQWFAEKNIEILEKTDADVIISDCGSCSSFIKSYAEITENSDLKKRAEIVAAKFKDMTNWINENINDVEFPTNGRMTKMTYHDPCHLAHHLKERKAPRDILQNLSHVDYVEMDKADMCCGGAGSYNIAHPEMSFEILDIKMDNVKTTEADVLVTACPACVMQLAFGTRKNKMPVQVKHISQVVAEKFK